jgi:hypothetical protein
MTLKNLAASFLLLLLIGNSASAKDDWYSRDWFGGSHKGGCLITTNDVARDRSLTFGFSDGRSKLTDFVFNPILTVSVSNVTDGLSSRRTEYLISVVFNDVAQIETTAQSGLFKNVDLYSKYIFKGKLSNYFEPKNLKYNDLVKLMKQANTMAIHNSDGREVAKLSLMGFTKIYSNFASCVSKLSN